MLKRCFKDEAHFKTETSIHVEKSQLHNRSKIIYVNFYQNNFVNVNKDYCWFHISMLINHRYNEQYF